MSSASEPFPKVQQPAQPVAVTIAIIANLLLWGYPIPVGVGTLAPNAVITVICGLAVRGREQRNCSRTFLATILALAYGCCVVPFSPFAPNIAKLVFSLALFVCCAFSVKRLAEPVNLEAPLLAPRLAWTCIVAVIAAVLIHYLLLLLAGGLDQGPIRASGLYSEPSHLALSVSPLLFYLGRISQGIQRLLVLGAAIVVLVLASSSTFILLLAALMLFWFVITRRMLSLKSVLLARVSALRVVTKAVRVTVMLMFVVILAVGFSVSALSSHSLDRATGVLEARTNSSDLGNLSSAVYLNGWLDMSEYLRLTRGLGVGFNQMGVSGRPDTWITRLMTVAGLGDQNATEGSFIVSKLGSEFGVVGLLIWLSIALSTATVCRRAARPGRKVETQNMVFMFAVLAVIGVGGVIRSTPYFSGPFLLALFALYIAQSSTVVPQRLNPGSDGSI